MNANALAGLVTGEKIANLPQEKKLRNIQIAGLTIKLEHFIDKVKGTVKNTNLKAYNLPLRLSFLLVAFLQ